MVWPIYKDFIYLGNLIRKWGICQNVFHVKKSRSLYVFMYILRNHQSMYNTHALHRMRPFFKFPSLSPPCLPGFRKRSKPGMNAGKREKKMSMFRLPSEDLTWIHVQNKRKDYELGNRVVVRMLMTMLVMTPWRFWWWWWWWWWQGWWGRSWQIPVMLIESQSDDIGLYGFKRIILQVLLITREFYSAIA